MILLFKAFSALLSYPTEETRRALPEIAEVVRRSPLVASREREALLGLVGEIGQGEQLAAEERYVDLFDRGRALSLHLFEHLHGESRDRGSAMVELKRLYEAAGYDLAANELPDYLPVVLEYLSLRDMVEGRAMLADCAHILKTIAKSLIGRRSRYAAVLQALIVIAGDSAVDASTVPAIEERPGALDRDWSEQPAFEVPTPAGRPVS